MRKIIAIANQKGGVGKTTTAINLSSALTMSGKKVLLVDMDPQGNAGRGLGLDVTASKATIYEAIEGIKPIAKCIAKTAFEGLSVIPANLKLSQLEAFGVTHPTDHPFELLKQKLHEIPDEFDYIVIDCPPSLGFLCLNALTASNCIIIPVQCEYFALEAVAAMLATIKKVQSSYNSGLFIEGFLLTMYDPRTSLGTEISTEVRGLFKEHTFVTAIPRNQSIAESQGRMQPVTVFRPTSSGSYAYLALAREVLDHEKRQG